MSANPAVFVSPFPAEQVAFAREVDAAVLAHHDHHAFNEAVRRDLNKHGSPDATLIIGESTVAYVWHIDTGDGHWEITIADLPGMPGDDRRVVLDTALARIRATGGGDVVCWVPGRDPALDEALTAADFALDRVLLQLRVELPVRESARWPDDVEVRPYDDGTDRAALIAVNNRAFANHPEQGGWDDAAMQSRLDQAWVDPTGFLVVLRDDTVVGFIWMKLHALELIAEPLGEIYAVAVDPAHQGQGLGRALALAGLDWASQHVPTGMLYVDASNTAAIAMYESLGFGEHHRNRAFTAAVAP